MSSAVPRHNVERAPVITTGIDLASDPAKTGLCVVEWGAAPRCLELRVGVDDATAVDAALTSHRCGIDAPFGWPDAFVGFVAGHHKARSDASRSDNTEPLRLRATDLWVWHHHQKRPLSVSTDRLGITAFRCARLQAIIAERTGAPIDRTGRGLLLEAYPAGALAAWGLESTRYKRRTPESLALRRSLAASVVERFGLRLSPEHEELAATNDDALDALITAIVARLAELGRTTLPPPELEASAGREGWIHVPTDA